MPSFILPFKQLFFTPRTGIRNILLMRTITTYHGQSIKYFMLLYRVDIMTFITGKWSSTTSISHPPEVQLIVIACTFQWKFFVILELELLNKGIEVFDTIVLYVHVGKAGMAVKLHFLSRKIQLGLDNFSITFTTNLPPHTTNIHKLAISHRHPTHQLPLIMYNRPFPHNPHTIITLLTLELNPQFQLLPLLRIEQIHEHSRAVAFYIEQQLFDNEIGAVVHDEGLDGYLIVEVLVLGFLVVVEVELEVVAEFTFGFLQDGVGGLVAGGLLRLFGLLWWALLAECFVRLLVLLVLSIVVFQPIIILLLRAFLLLFLSPLFLFLFLILLLLFLPDLFLFDLNFLFQLYLLKMLILQPELRCLVILFEIVLQEFKGIEYSVSCVIFRDDLEEFGFVGRGDAGVEDLECGPLLRVVGLVDFELEVILLEYEVHRHLLIIQQRPNPHHIHLTFIPLLLHLIKRVLIPPNNLIVLLLLLTLRLPQQLQKTLLLKIPLLHLLDMLLGLQCLTVIGE